MVAASLAHPEGAKTLANNLQDAIAAAGSAHTLLWESQSPAILATPVTPEFTNWRDEQMAWRRTSVLFDQSHHMADLNIKGPDALKLIRDTAVNSVESFPIDAAKQYVAVNEEGQLIGDNILFRYEEDEFQAVGIPPSINWLQFHAETGGYDVEIWRDNPSYARDRRPGRLPLRGAGPRGHATSSATRWARSRPRVKFFHGGRRFTIAGRPVRALRHGMAGEPGFEFVGPWADRDAMVGRSGGRGQEHGMVQVGGRAYLTNTLESGWLPRPLPAFYSGAELEAFRRWLPADEIDATVSLGGSHYSPDLEDYYFSPFDVGYGRIIKFDHDFIGREALEQQVADGRSEANQKVTLVWNDADAEKAFGSMFGPGPGAKYINLPIAHYATYHYDRVESDGGDYAGRSLHTGYSANERSMLSLAVVDAATAEPGTEVVVVWVSRPRRPSPGSRTTCRCASAPPVQPAPLIAKARGEYRSNASVA